MKEKLALERKEKPIREKACELTMHRWNWLKKKSEILYLTTRRDELSPSKTNNSQVKTGAALDDPASVYDNGTHISPRKS